MGYRKNSFNRKLFLSYLILVAVIVCMVSAGAYTVFRRMYMQNVDEINKRTLKLTADLYEEKILRPLSDTYRDLFISSAITKEVNSFYRGQEVEPMEVYSASRYLINKTNTDPFISEIHLYSENSRSLLSTRFGYKIEGDAADILKQFHFDADQLKGVKFPVVAVPFSYWAEPGESYCNIIYSTNVNGKTSVEPDGYVIFTLNLRSIGDLLNRVSEGEVSLINDEGTVICTADLERIGERMELGDLEDYSVHMEEDRVVSYLRSTLDSLYFVTETSADGYYPAVRQLISQMFLILGVMLVAGGVVAIAVSYHMNRSLVKITTRIQDVLGEGSGEKHKDLEVIIDTICNEFYSLDEFTKNNKEVIKNQFVMNLYMGHLESGQELDSKVEYIGLEPGKNQFVAAMIHCSFRNFADVDAYQIAIYRVIHDLQNNRYDLSVIASEVETNWVAILYQGSDMELFSSLLEQILAGSGSRVYIGNMCKSCNGAGKSFQRLQKLSAYEFFCPGKRIWREEELKDEIASYEPDLAKLGEAVRKIDVESSQAAMEAVLNDMAEKSIAVETRNEVLLKLISVVSDIARSKGVHLAKIQNVIESEHVLEFVKSYKVLLQEWKDSWSNKQRTKKEEEVNAIQRFVEENYDKDLSLSVIAEHVHMHPAYVSRFFKEQTGKNITEYIKEIKLKEAERLLRTTDDSVEKIAGMIGYNTTHYFIRQFKETYGMTPTVYKKEHDKK